MSANNPEHSNQAFAYVEKYRTAEALLQVRPLSVNELIKENCLVVMDTNSLLVPFSTTPKSWDTIQAELKKLAAEERLRIPRHVVREFVENRVHRLADLYAGLQDVAGQVRKIEIPFLESDRAYKKAQEAYKAVETAANAYRKAAREVRDVVRQLRWNDPVTMFLAGLPATAFIEPELAKSYQEDIAFEIDRRKSLDIGPGLKDSNKDVNSAGDYLIWMSILDLGTTSRQHALFVTSETKNDWWHESSKTPLYPRFELVAEYWKATDGRTFHIVTLNQLLDILNVDKKIVKEVTTIEELSQSKSAEGAMESTLGTRRLTERLLRLSADARPRPPRILQTPEDELERQSLALMAVGFLSKREASRAMVHDSEFRKWLRTYHGRERVARRPLYRADAYSRFAEYVALKQRGVEGLRNLYLELGHPSEQAAVLAARVYNEVHAPALLE